MPLRSSNQEWLDLNAQRRYPLALDADGIDTSGAFILPDDFIVELDLAVAAASDVAPGQFFIRNIGAYGTGYSIVVGYQPASGPAVSVATALVASQLHTRNQVYALGGLGDFIDVAGKLVIGSLGNIAKQPPGFFTFELEHSRLDPDAIRPQIRGVSAITLVVNGQPSRPLYGDIQLVAGNNMRLTATTGLDGSTSVRFDAVSGAGTIEGDNLPAPPQPILTINGIAPDAEGNFTLLGNDCLRVVPRNGGVTLADVCSQPCCTCADLEAITQELRRFADEQANVQTFVNQLATQVNAMRDTVLGSRLSDIGCS